VTESTTVVLTPAFYHTSGRSRSKRGAPDHTKDDPESRERHCRFTKRREPDDSPQYFDAGKQSFAEFKKEVTRMKDEMWQRKADMIKKRLDLDPYDTIFGWSNRLRVGLPPRVWVWGDTLKSKSRHDEEKGPDAADNLYRSPSSPDSSLFASRESTEPSTKSKVADTFKSTPQPSAADNANPSHEPETKDSNATEQKDIYQRGVPTPLHSSYSYSLEYDPISHRTVRRRDGELSHYGQDLDTSVNVPMAKSDPIPSVLAPEPTKRDLQTELKEYKARKLPGTLTEGTEHDVTPTAQNMSGTEDTGDSNTSYFSQRAKLEKSFSDIHSHTAEASKFSPLVFSTRKKRHQVPKVPTNNDRMEAEKKTETQKRLQDLQGLSAQLASLGERIGRLQPTVESVYESKDKMFLKESGTASHSGPPTSTEGISFQKSNEKAISPAEGYRKLLELEKEAEAATTKSDPSELSRTQTSNWRRRLEMNDIDQEVAATPEKAAISPAEEYRKLLDLEKEAEAVTSKPDPSEVSLAQSSNWRKRLEMDDIDRKVVASPEQTTPAAEESSKNELSESNDEQPCLQERRLQLEADLEPVSPFQKQDDTNGNSEDVQKSSFSVPKQGQQQTETPSETAVYTILAYDPSTSEVSTTDISAPVNSADESIPLTEGLTRLTEPAKFLPHLRLLQDQGFVVVKSTKNMLVLRGSPAVPTSTTPVTESSTKSNDIKEPSRTTSMPSPSRVPKRVEEIYTGPQRSPHRLAYVERVHTRHGKTTAEPKSRSKERTNGSEQRSRSRAKEWAFRLLFASSMTTAVIYLAGLSAGFKRVPYASSPENSGKNSGPPRTQKYLW
jgi:hypothetical protein